MNTIVSSIQPYIAGVLLAIAALPARGQAARPPGDDQLKNYLMGEFIAFEGYDRAITRRLKDGGVTDEQLRRVLASIYAESEAAFAQARDQYARMTSSLRRANAIRELGSCADNGTKTFLLDMAADRSKDGVLRTVALSSYLRAADANEAKDALIRVLVGEERMGSLERLSVYSSARVSYEDSTSQEKKTAILAALVAAASREEGKIEFMKVDRILAERSAAYLRSHERLAMLERHRLEPPTANLYTDRDLKTALDEARKVRHYTSVSTNLVALKARNFNQPLADDGWANLIIPPPVAPAAAAAAGSETPRASRRIVLYTLGGAAVVTLVVAGVWRFRRRGASRP